MNEAIVKKIQRRRRQILVHSYMYYELNDSTIDDATWSERALELETLQRDYPEESRAAKYFEEFKDFDHSTGADLDYFKDWVIRDALLLLDYRDKPNPRTKWRFGYNELVH